MRKKLFYLLSIGLLVILFQNCSGDSTNTSESDKVSVSSILIDRSFELQRVELPNGSEKIYPQVVSIRFVGHDQVDGQIQCNGYSAEIELDSGTKLRFVETSMTLMGCGLDASETFEFDDEYSLKIEDHQLILESVNDGTVLYFSEQFEL